jgi:hypothetical protein
MDVRLMEMVSRSAMGSSSVIEYGCGDCEYIGQMHDIPFRGGVDVVVPKTLPEGVWFARGDMLRLPSPVGWSGTAMFLDSIEHLGKDRAFEMLARAKALFEAIIVFTPNGMWVQRGTPENPYQEHRSGWTVPDFDGWSVEMTRGIGSAPESIYAVWRR